MAQAHLYSKDPISLCERYFVETLYSKGLRHILEKDGREIYDIFYKIWAESWDSYLDQYANVSDVSEIYQYAWKELVKYFTGEKARRVDLK